jgi:hypothetical protein
MYNGNNAQKLTEPAGTIPRDDIQQCLTRLPLLDRMACLPTPRESVDSAVLVAAGLLWFT